MMEDEEPSKSDKFASPEDKNDLGNYDGNENVPISCPNQEVDIDALPMVESEEYDSRSSKTSTPLMKSDEIPVFTQYAGKYGFKVIASEKSDTEDKKSKRAVFQTEENVVQCFYVKLQPTCWQLNYSSSLPKNTKNTFIRIVPVYGDLEKAICILERCPIHKEINAEDEWKNRSMIVVEEGYAHYYQDPISKRVCIMFPYEEPKEEEIYSSVICKFLCYNSCFLSDYGGRQALYLIVTHEMIDTKTKKFLLLGRQCLQFRCCACPLRDWKERKLQEEKDALPDTYDMSDDNRVPIIINGEKVFIRVIPKWGPLIESIDRLIRGFISFSNPVLLDNYLSINQECEKYRIIQEDLNKRFYVFLNDDGDHIPSKQDSRKSSSRRKSQSKHRRKSKQSKKASKLEISRKFSGGKQLTTDVINDSQNACPEGSIAAPSEHLSENVLTSGSQFYRALPEYRLPTGEIESVYNPSAFTVSSVVYSMPFNSPRDVSTTHCMLQISIPSNTYNVSSCKTRDIFKVPICVPFEDKKKKARARKSSLKKSNQETSSNSETQTVSSNINSSDISKVTQQCDNRSNPPKRHRVICNRSRSVRNASKQDTNSSTSIQRMASSPALTVYNNLYNPCTSLETFSTMSGAYSNMPDFNAHPYNYFPLPNSSFGYSASQDNFRGAFENNTLYPSQTVAPNVPNTPYDALQAGADSSNFKHPSVSKYEHTEPSRNIITPVLHRSKVRRSKSLHSAHRKKTISPCIPVSQAVELKTADTVSSQLDTKNSSYIPNVVVSSTPGFFYFRHSPYDPYYLPPALSSVISNQYDNDSTVHCDFGSYNTTDNIDSYYQSQSEQKRFETLHSVPSNVMSSPSVPISITELISPNNTYSGSNTRDNFTPECFYEHQSPSDSRYLPPTLSSMISNQYNNVSTYDTSDEIRSYYQCEQEPRRFETLHSVPSTVITTNTIYNNCTSSAVSSCGNPQIASAYNTTSSSIDLHTGNYYSPNILYTTASVASTPELSQVHVTGKDNQYNTATRVSAIPHDFGSQYVDNNNDHASQIAPNYYDQYYYNCYYDFPPNMSNDSIDFSTTNFISENSNVIDRYNPASSYQGYGYYPTTSSGHYNTATAVSSYSNNSFFHPFQLKDSTLAGVETNAHYVGGHMSHSWNFCENPPSQPGADKSLLSDNQYNMMNWDLQMTPDPCSDDRYQPADNKQSLVTRSQESRDLDKENNFQ